MVPLENSRCARRVNESVLFADEDWSQDPADSTLYLMHGTTQVTLPRASRHAENDKNSPEPIKSEFRTEQRFSRYQEPKSPKYDEEKYYKTNSEDKSDKYHKYVEKKYGEQQKAERNSERYEGRVKKYQDQDKYDRYQENFEKIDRKYLEERLETRKQHYEDYQENGKYRPKSQYEEEEPRIKGRYIEDGTSTFQTFYE